MLSQHSRLIFLCLIFITGGVVLSLELIASRIMAPFFGVSLYIWTAILSVTLTFLALGYQFGGWLTIKYKKEDQESLFLAIPIISTFFIFISCLLYPVILPNLSGLSLIVGSFVGSSILLAFPLVFLSAINPILISILSQSTKFNDSGAGFVFFISTFGSVIGVLMTSLLLVPNVTNYSAVLINGIVLVSFTITANLITQRKRNKFFAMKRLASSLLILALCTLLLIWKNDYLGIVTTDINKNGTRLLVLEEFPSHYGNLKIVGLIPKGKKHFSRYGLLQDGLTQNIISKNGKSLSAYTYNLVKLTGFAPQAKNALVLGLGAGVVPNKLSELGMDVSVVEINPDTLKAAEKYFHYKQQDTKIFFQDARTFVKGCTNEYDIVVIDLFQGDGMPEHITTKEFYQDIKNCMHSNGILVSNSFIGKENKAARMSFLATIFSVFGNTHFFQGEKAKYNSYVVATKTHPPKHIHFDLRDIPKKINKKVVSALKSHKEYQQDALSKYETIRDNGNTFSSLFAKQSMQFRKGLASRIPSRVLIN